MKKLRIYFFLICIFNLSLKSQGPPCFTWMSGSDSISVYGMYGTKGVSSPTNRPGSRGTSFFWKDNSGNFWLFGGWGYSSSSLPALNDLWKYNVSINEWTWMSGTNLINQSGLYGTKGVASATTMPGSRHRCRTQWKDNSGNFWLFGGNGFDTYGNNGKLNDLWKYDVVNNNWTWISGTDTVDKKTKYGTKGVASTTNNPGGRGYSQSWTDNTGKFWLLGGRGYPNSGISGYLNDLWKYDLTNNTWNWISGDSTAGSYSTYGTKGVASPLNKPGARGESSTWVDNNGDLWLFGGTGYVSSTGGFGILNDLWKYSISSNQWTWIGGDSAISKNGVYGVQGIASALNKPGARAASITWVQNNNLWLHGGTGYDAVTTSSNGALNDLWMYNISSNQWMWVVGATSYSQTSVFGTKGVSAPQNIAGGRWGSASWQDNNNLLWLFGGFDVWNQFYYDDLWRINLVRCDVGIEEYSANSNLIRCYPNPNNGEFEIRSDRELDLKLVNELGQTLQIIQLSSANNFTTKIKNISSGIYFIVGIKDVDFVRQKIIVTR